jgi:hypothetical protein
MLPRTAVGCDEHQGRGDDQQHDGGKPAYSPAQGRPPLLFDPLVKPEAETHGNRESDGGHHGQPRTDHRQPDAADHSVVGQVVEYAGRRGRDRERRDARDHGEIGRTAMLESRGQISPGLGEIGEQAIVFGGGVLHGRGQRRPLLPFPVVHFGLGVSIGVHRNPPLDKLLFLGRVRGDLLLLRGPPLQFGQVDRIHIVGVFATTLPSSGDRLRIPVKFVPVGYEQRARAHGGHHHQPNQHFRSSPHDETGPQASPVSTQV